MKKQRYIMVNDNVRRTVLQVINDIECDGTTAVEITPAGSKSDSQRGLQWMWNTDVSTSGIGGKHEETKEGVHIVSKWYLARPILKRDYPERWKFIAQLITANEGDMDAMLYIADHYISTEGFNLSQMAEYLTDFRSHWVAKGANLRDPQDQGLLT